VITAHDVGNKVDYGANTRYGLEILMNHEPPVSDDIDFGLHDANEIFVAARHEMGQHSETRAGAGCLELSDNARAGKTRLRLFNHITKPTDRRDRNQVIHIGDKGMQVGAAISP